MNVLGRFSGWRAHTSVSCVAIGWTVAAKDVSASEITRKKSCAWIFFHVWIFYALSLRSSEWKNVNVPEVHAVHIRAWHAFFTQWIPIPRLHGLRFKCQEFRICMISIGTWVFQELIFSSLLSCVPRKCSWFSRFQTTSSYLHWQDMVYQCMGNFKKTRLFSH